MDLELDAGSPLRAVPNRTLRDSRKLLVIPLFKNNCKKISSNYNSLSFAFFLNFARKTGHFEDCNRERMREGSKDFNNNKFRKREIMPRIHPGFAPNLPFIVKFLRTLFSTPHYIPRGNQYLELCVFRHVSPAMPSQQRPPWGMCLWGQLARYGVTGILGAMTCHIHPYNTSTHHYSYRGSLHATDSGRIQEGTFRKPRDENRRQQ